MMGRAPTSIACCAAALGLAAGAAAESGNYLLIRRDEPAQPVEVAEIGPRAIVYRQGDGGWMNVPRDRCVALLRTDAVISVRRHGWLRLADGQQFPGEALSNSRPAVVAWNQMSWLGRLEVPLDRVASVILAPGAEVPEPGEADVVTFTNGDRLDGIVAALGDPIVVEMLKPAPGAPARVELPLDRVAAVRLVTPPQPPSGRRVWLMDGTVLDAGELALSDDGLFRLQGLPFTEESSQRLEMQAVAGVLFDVTALVPFASLPVRRVQGPPTRYVVPEPRALDEQAPLDLSRVEFRGPLTVHYVLPPGATRFAAEARLPAVDRNWGDCRVIVRVDEQQVFAAPLNAAQPTASIDVPLHGSTLSIEITEGAAGPIQDRVIFDRPMVLR